MSFKKLVFCLSLVSLLLMPAFAEGNKEKSSSDTTVIRWWHLDTEDEMEAIWQGIADEYTKLHPDVKVEITVLENEAFKSKLATLMQSGNPPDVFRSWGGGVMNAYAQAGLLRDITKELSGGWGDSFGEGALKVYSYKGRYYGVPYDMGAVGFWYNKKMFAEVGYATPPATWTEFLDCVKKLKAAGYIPIALGEGDKWPGHFFWAYLAVRLGGFDAFDAAANRTGAFTDATFVKAGEKLNELIALEPFQTGYLSATYGDESALVGNGKAAMELMGQWAPYSQEGNSESGKGLGDDLGYFNFPQVEGGVGKASDVMGGGNGYVIGRDAPDAAVDFLKFITNKENNASMAAKGKVIPTVKGAEETIQDPSMKVVQQAVANAGYYQLYYDQYLPPAVAEVVKDAVQTLFAGTASPEEAAAMVEEAMALESE